MRKYTNIKSQNDSKSVINGESHQLSSKLNFITITYNWNSCHILGIWLSFYNTHSQKEELFKFEGCLSFVLYKHVNIVIHEIELRSTISAIRFLLHISYLKANGIFFDSKKTSGLLDRRILSELLVTNERNSLISFLKITW